MAISNELEKTYAGPAGPTNPNAVPPEEITAPVGVGPSPPTSPAGGGIRYNPDEPVYAATGTPEPAVEPAYDQTSFRDTVGDIYNENSPEIENARQNAKEGYAGKGLLFSDIAAEGGEAAAMSKAMEMAAPDTQFAQGKDTATTAFERGKEMSATDFERTTQRDETQFGYQKDMADQMNKYDVDTQQRMQDFGKENATMAHGFNTEIQQMGFDNDMEAALLNTVQNMLNGGNQALTSLAMSGEATTNEVANIQKSLRNSLTTFTNIWKGSAGSGDTFDFSGIG